MLDYGLSFSLGTIFRTILEKFGESRSKTATLQSLYVGVTCMSTIFTGLFISKWGVCRGITCAAFLMPVGFFAAFFAQSIVYLFVSVGVIGGIGNSFALMSCVVAVGQSFPEHQRSVAMSIFITALGTTTLVYPYFISWLIVLYGLNGTFLVLSAVYLHSFFAVTVFRYEIETHGRPVRKFENDSESLSNSAIPSVEMESGMRFSGGQIAGHGTKAKPHENGKYAQSEKMTKLNDKPGKLTSPIFLIFLTASAILVGNCSGFLSVAQDIFIDKGLSEREALSGYLVFNLVSVILRLVPAFTSKLGLDSFIVSMIVSISAVAGQMIIYWFSSHVAILIGSGLSGAAFGGFASVMPIKAFELLGTDKQAIGYGMIVTAVGALSTSCGPLFGAIRDATGQYSYVLITSSSLNGLCFVLILTCLAIQRLKRGKPSQT